MKRHTVAAIAMLVPAFVSAEPYQTLPSASQLTADISRLGEREVLVNRLWPNDQVFEGFLIRVETGTPVWLGLAARLKRESDAGASESELAP